MWRETTAATLGERRPSKYSQIKRTVSLHVMAPPQSFPHWSIEHEMLQFGGAGRLRQQTSEINYLRESDGAVMGWSRRLIVGNFSGKVHFVMVSLGDSDHRHQGDDPSIAFLNASG